MSEEEFYVLAASSVGIFLFWVPWIRDIMVIYDRRGRYAGIAAFFAPFFALGILFFVLRNFSSLDVRSNPVYIVFYMAFGLAWCGLMTKFFSFLGLDFRHDVAEQDNYAADVAISGAVLGSMLCFSGGNIGDGPGWWVVFFCAAVATVVWMLVWIVVDQVNGVCEAITVDQDLATGIRFAGFLAASGLVFGRAMAGNWVSAAATLTDFWRVSAPLGVLVVIALLLDRLFCLSKEVPRQNVFVAGFLPAGIYIFLSVCYVLHLGAW